MERGREKEQKRCDCEDEDRAMAKKDNELSMKERTLGLEKTKADIKKTVGHSTLPTRVALPDTAALPYTGARRQGALQHRQRVGRRQLIVAVSRRAAGRTASSAAAARARGT